MATYLPTELWEKIAAHLPPPLPKLTPCLSFSNELREPTQSTFMTGLWTTQISKAVSVEEASAITKNHFWRFVEMPDRWLGKMDGRDVDEIVSNSMLYGWDFASYVDRQSYENRGRTFRLVKKMC